MKSSFPHLSMVPPQATSATVVPDALRQNIQPNGFSGPQRSRILFIAGEPRHCSLTWDLLQTAMHFFMSHHCGVTLRDLYALDFNPVLDESEFYYVKDGIGHPPSYLATEQALIAAADILIFVYPNWHDAPVAIVKGYMEKVFAKSFAYTDGPRGPQGLLSGRRLYTIMNCGYLGGGQGYLGDGIGHDDALWDRYMAAFKVFDDDTAHFWGMRNAGRFVNDRHPKNGAPDYAHQLETLRAVLRAHLARDLG